MFAVSCRGAGPPPNQDGKSPASRRPGLASLTQAGCELWTMCQARSSSRPPGSLVWAQARVPTLAGRRPAWRFTDMTPRASSAPLLARGLLPRPHDPLSAGVWDQKAGGVGARSHLPTPGAASALGRERIEGQTMPPVGPGPPPGICPARPDLTAQRCAPGPREAGPAQLPSLPPPGCHPRPASWARPAPATAQKHNRLPQCVWEARGTGPRPVRTGSHRACARRQRRHPRSSHSLRSNKGKGENQKGFKPKPQSSEEQGVLRWFSFCSPFLGPPS